MNEEFSPEYVELINRVVWLEEFYVLGSEVSDCLMKGERAGLILYAVEMMYYWLLPYDLWHEDIAPLLDELLKHVQDQRV
jgi:hypothetical protein